MRNIITIVFIALLSSCNSKEEKTPMTFKAVAPTVGGTITLAPGDSVIKIPPSKDTAVVRFSVNTIQVKPIVTTTATVSYTPVSSPGGPVVVPPVDTVVTVPPVNNPAGWNPPAKTRMVTGFEAGLTDGWNKYIQQPYTNPAYVTKSTEQKSEGNYSAKFYMTSAAAQATGESHAQLTKIDIETLREGDERWYENDYYIAGPLTATIGYLKQWHHDYSNYSPPIALCTLDGQLQWNYITTLQGKDQFVKLSPVILNKWFNVKIHLIFSATSGKALTEIWIDNVKKMTLTVPNKFSQYGNIEMIGQYVWTWKSTSFSGLSRTFYIDNYKYW